MHYFIGADSGSLLFLTLIQLLHSSSDRIISDKDLPVTQ
jgi:hypothetical protein